MEKTVYENDWNKLFSYKGKDLKAKNVPIPARKYILRHLEYFRLGEYDLIKETERTLTKSREEGNCGPNCQELETCKSWKNGKLPTEQAHVIGIFEVYFL